MTELTRVQLGVAAGILVLALGSALFAFLRRRKRVLSALGDEDVLRRLGIPAGITPWARVALPMAAALALAGALLDPGLGAGAPAVRGPVVLLLDASGSMLVHDESAPRLAIQREIATELASRLSDTPIGVVAFAGRAFSLTPPTRDLGAVDMYLQTVDPTIVTQSGSALGAAIRQGLGLIAAGEGEGGTIVLIGDGDETDDAETALAAADLAGRSGVRIHALGVGSEEGGPVPSIDLSTGVASGFLRDADGEVLVSRAQPDLLREIASRGGNGVYASASDPDAVAAVVEGITGGGERGGSAEESWPPYFWLGLLAFALLLLQPLLEHGPGWRRT